MIQFKKVKKESESETTKILKEQKDKINIEQARKNAIELNKAGEFLRQKEHNMKQVPKIPTISKLDVKSIKSADPYLMKIIPNKEALLPGQYITPAREQAPYLTDRVSMNLMDIKEINGEGVNDGYGWSIKNTKFIRILAESFVYQPKKLTVNHSNAYHTGYMMSKYDFKNCIISMYMNPVKLSDNSRITLGFRGGYNDIMRPCESCGYNINIDGKGKVTVQKQYYVSEDGKGIVPDEKVLGKINLAENKWIGIAGLVRNIKPHNEVAVTLYSDEKLDGKSWMRNGYVTDDRNWGGDIDTRCGGQINQTITWGGPVLRIEVRNIDDFRFDFIGFREIEN